MFGYITDYQVTPLPWVLTYSIYFNKQLIKYKTNILMKLI